jgi:hypothetical protein
MENKRSMMIYSAELEGKASFRLLPVAEDCPYNEIVYDPQEKILAIVSKQKKEEPMFISKLTWKNKLQQNNKERIIFEKYYEYYLENITDIINSPYCRTS